MPTAKTQQHQLDAATGAGRDRSTIVVTRVAPVVGGGGRASVGGVGRGSRASSSAAWSAASGWSPGWPHGAGPLRHGARHAGRRGRAASLTHAAPWRRRGCERGSCCRRGLARRSRAARRRATSDGYVDVGQADRARCPGQTPWKMATLPSSVADVVLVLGPGVGGIRAADEDDEHEHDGRGRSATQPAPRVARRLLGQRARPRRPRRGGPRPRATGRRPSRPGVTRDRRGCGPRSRTAAAPTIWGGWRAVAAVGEVDDVGDDDGDVVGGAGLEGELDEPVGGLRPGVVPRRGSRRWCRRATKSVRPSERAGSGRRCAASRTRDVGLVVVLAGQDPGHERALRVAARLLRGDPALVDEAAGRTSGPW